MQKLPLIQGEFLYLINGFYLHCLLFSKKFDKQADFCYNIKRLQKGYKHYRFVKETLLLVDYQ